MVADAWERGIDGSEPHDAKKVANSRGVAPMMIFTAWSTSSTELEKVAPSLAARSFGAKTSAVDSAGDSPAETPSPWEGDAVTLTRAGWANAAAGSDPE